jgi:hypothetical protein
MTAGLDAVLPDRIGVICHFAVAKPARHGMVSADARKDK